MNRPSASGCSKAAVPTMSCSVELAITDKPWSWVVIETNRMVSMTMDGKDGRLCLLACQRQSTRVRCSQWVARGGLPRTRAVGTPAHVSHANLRQGVKNERPGSTGVKRTTGRRGVIRRSSAAKTNCQGLCVCARPHRWIVATHRGAVPLPKEPPIS